MSAQPKLADQRHIRIQRMRILYVEHILTTLNSVYVPYDSISEQAFPHARNGRTRWSTPLWDKYKNLSLNLTIPKYKIDAQ